MLVLDSETLFCDNSQDGIWAPARNWHSYTGSGCHNYTRQHHSSVETLSAALLSRTRYLELDIPCKNPALHDTVLAALAAVHGAGPDPMIIWLGIQNILICDTISSSQQSAVSRWRVVHRLQVQGIYSALYTGGTGLENMSWCQYPVSPQRGCSMHDSYTRTTLPTHSCFYTTLAQKCDNS